jgi:hypothetical protein
LRSPAAVAAAVAATAAAYAAVRLYLQLPLLTLLLMCHCCCCRFCCCEAIFGHQECACMARRPRRVQDWRQLRSNCHAADGSHCSAQMQPGTSLRPTFPLSPVDTHNMLSAQGSGTNSHGRMEGCQQQPALQVLHVCGERSQVLLPARSVLLTLTMY